MSSVLILKILCVTILIVPCHIYPMIPSLPSRFHQSIECGDLEEVQSLMARQADPNGVCYLSARTPLETAATFKRPTIIKYLLAHGALLTPDIILCLLRSGHSGHTEFTFKDVTSSLKILLEAGASANHIKDIPKGYLLPVMLAHSDYEKAHSIITGMIRDCSVQKIA